MSSTNCVDSLPNLVKSCSRKYLFSVYLLPVFTFKYKYAIVYPDIILHEVRSRVAEGAFSQNFRFSSVSTCPRIAFLASPVEDAQHARLALIERYGNWTADRADVICALGGDGFMLQILHRYGGPNAHPIFGMRLGSVGFLMNDYSQEDLDQRITRAVPAVLPALQAEVKTKNGSSKVLLAYNEVALLRQTRQAAHVSIVLNGAQRIERLVGDGLLVATPAGSTAYNYSAHGPILPLRSHTLALTPLAVYRPRRWRGAILHSDTHICLRILDPDKRPVSVASDSQEIRHALEAQIRLSFDHFATLLFDSEQSLEERIFNEQFVI